MRTPSGFHLVWMLTNLVGIGAFLKLASQSWIEPALAEIPGASGGDAMVWAFHAVPVLLLFTLANIASLIATPWRKGASHHVRPGLPVVLLICWVVAALFDNMHHGI